MNYLKLLFFSVLFCTALRAGAFVYADNQQLISNTDSLRVVLPVTIDYDNKIVTPFVNIKVNGKLVKVVFDTGSSGLRILSGALHNLMPDSSVARVSYTYGDNVHSLGIRGVVVKAEISFENLKTLSPVNIMSIDSTRYGRHEAWTATGDSAVIHSNHFRDCAAIMGVGLRGRLKSGAVVSPLRQIPGNGKFIIMFPAYGNTKGAVIINPTPADETGFVYFQLPAGEPGVVLPGHGWPDNQLPGCIAINDAMEYLPTMLDTGNPDIQIFSPDYERERAVPPRNYITMQIGGARDTTVVKTGFNIGDDRVRGKDFIYMTNTTKEKRLVFGMRFFFEFDVLYDQQNGIVGIRKKLHKK